MKITKLLTQHQIPFKTNEPLAPYTYIKIGGPAQYLVVAADTSTLKTSIKLAHQAHTPYTVLGSASNVLIADEGLLGLTIINRAQEISLDPHNPHRVISASGTLITQLIHFTQQHHLSGLENFLGLPGTVGGAVYNNSHHLDHLIGECVDTVTVFTTKGQEKILKAKDLDFTYDYSLLQKTADTVIEVSFLLEPSKDAKASVEQAKAALMRRRQTQPLEFPSSGCMFKNPQTIHNPALPPEATHAGYLVDQSGLKGTKRGGAMVSPKHANFIVNAGNATAADIIALSDLVIATVKEKFGVELEREIFILKSPQVTPKSSERN